MTFRTKLINPKHWSVNVKGGEMFEVVVREGEILHLTQVSLMTKNHMGEYVSVCFNVDGTEFGLATLHTKMLPQYVCRVVFDKTWTISHDWKNGILSCSGYTSEQPAQDRKFGPGNAETQKAKEVEAKKDQMLKDDGFGSNEGIEVAADEAHICMPI